MMRTVALAIALSLLPSCGCENPPPAHPAPLESALAAAPVPPPPPSVVVEPPPPAPEPAVAVSLPIVEDDIDGARAGAVRGGKLLLVEAWAPWCHTCLSMKNFVLPDPSLVPLAADVVVAALDTERDENADFLQKHVVNTWPTLFVLDPENDQVLGYWPGAASAPELKRFVRQAVELWQAVREGSADPLVLGLLEAKGAQAAGLYDLASTRFAALARAAPREWPARSEVLYGWLVSEYRKGRAWSCARIGAQHIDDIEGAALPADASYVLLQCARKAGGATGEAGRTKAIARLRAHTEAPPADASVDDRADALAIYAEALSAAGDRTGARSATESRLRIMEEAVAQAATPAQAATFDYGRLGAYLALGRPDDAVSMFAARTRELPGSYEAWARYASVLSQLGRRAEALVALEQAISLSYGPRRLGYEEQHVDLLVRLGDTAAARTALQALVAGYEALPDTESTRAKRESSLAAARRKLATLSGADAP